MVGTIVWRDHVRFTYYYYTWTYEYNIRRTYIDGILKYLSAAVYTRMALSMAFTRCKTYNIAFRDRICIRYTTIILSCTRRGKRNGENRKLSNSFVNITLRARANGAHAEHRRGVSIIRRRKLSCGAGSTRSILNPTLQSIPRLLGGEEGRIIVEERGKKSKTDTLPMKK